jgi:hypothetical protein
MYSVFPLLRACSVLCCLVTWACLVLVLPLFFAGMSDSVLPMSITEHHEHSPMAIKAESPAPTELTELKPVMQAAYPSSPGSPYTQYAGINYTKLMRVPLDLINCVLLVLQ